MFEVVMQVDAAAVVFLRQGGSCLHWSFERLLRPEAGWLTASFSWLMKPHFNRRQSIKKDTMSCLRVQPKPIQKAALPLLPEAEAGGCRSFEVLRRLEEKSKEKTAVGFSLGQLLCKVRRARTKSMMRWFNSWMPMVATARAWPAWPALVCRIFSWLQLWLQYI